MKFGSGQIDKIIEKIISGSLPHLSSVVIGDNSSGKSLLLKKFMDGVEDRRSLYFIDAVNRGFDVRKAGRSSQRPKYKDTILRTRMDEAHFNLADSFNCYGTQTECLEMIYCFYQEHVQNLFFKLTGNRFRIDDCGPLGEVDFGFERGLLSSGYQAMIRILTELCYYHDAAVSEYNLKEYWIVIDELDEFLSPRYAAIFLEFLKKEFPDAKWLVTTHSCDLIAGTFHANLVILDDGDCEVLDIDDYSSVSEVQMIFERLFGKIDEGLDDKDKELRRLFNNRMNGAWGAEDDRRLEKLLGEKLSSSQRLILKQIQEW